MPTAVEVNASDVGLAVITGAFTTFNVTFTICGEFGAPAAATTTVPKYVPMPSEPAFTETFTDAGVTPAFGLAVNQDPPLLVEAEAV